MPRLDRPSTMRVKQLFSYALARQLRYLESSRKGHATGDNRISDKKLNQYSLITTHDR